MRLRDIFREVIADAAFLDGVIRIIEALANLAARGLKKKLQKQ